MAIIRKLLAWARAGRATQVSDESGTGRAKEQRRYDPNCPQLQAAVERDRKKAAEIVAFHNSLRSASDNISRSARASSIASRSSAPSKHGAAGSAQSSASASSDPGTAFFSTNGYGLLDGGGGGGGSSTSSGSCYGDSSSTSDYSSSSSSCSD